MAEQNLSRCPYCGSSLLTEEDGYRCRLCKSFFPYETEETAEGEEYTLAKIKPRIVEKPEEEPADTQADKEFQRIRSRNELIGMVTAFVGLLGLAFSKIFQMPLLMIPGFAFWAFSAGFTIYQIIKARKAGRKAAFVRIFALLVIAILMLLFVNPKK